MFAQDPEAKDSIIQNEASIPRLIDQLSGPTELVAKSMGLLQKLVAKRSDLKERVSEDAFPFILKKLEKVESIKSLETAKAMITFLQTLIWQCNSNVQKLMEAGGHAILQNWRENTVHRQDRQIVSRAEYILERIQPEGYS